MKMNKKRILILTALIVFGCTIFAFAAEDVFTAGETFITDAQKFILKITTPMAVIGIGIGSFILKMSKGNPQKIDTGNKAILYSILGWTVVNGAPLIFNTIQRYF